jgi:hypothetical protein
MGSKSKSNTYTDNSKKIVRKNELKMLNEQTNNFASDIAFKAAKSCSSGMSQLNHVDWSGTKVAGDFNFAGTQENEAAVTFDCVQADKVSGDMAAGIINKISDSLESNYSTDLLDKMNTEAQAKQKSGWGNIPMGASESTASTTNINKLDMKEESRKDLQNTIKNNTEMNFSQDTVSECTSEYKQANVGTFKDMEIGGNVNTVLKQSNAMKAMSSCKQMNDAISKITQQTASDLGVKIVDDSSTTQETDITSTTTSTQETQGIGGAIADVFGGIGSMFGSMYGPSIALSVVGVVVVLVVGMIAMSDAGQEAISKASDKMGGGSKSSSKSSNSNSNSNSYSLDSFSTLSNDL